LKATLTKVNQRNDAAESAESPPVLVFANNIRMLVQATFRQQSSDLHVEAKMLGHGEDILITATTHIHHDDMVLG
jgi:flagellar biosynthesis component FlhA